MEYKSIKVILLYRKNRFSTLNTISYQIHQKGSLKMSKITSYSNNRLPQKSFDHSMNTEDLIRQNEQLKQSIQELIQQNMQLTEIVQQLSKHEINNNGNIPNINQQEIEALAHQVIALQKQLDIEKQKNHNAAIHSQGDTQQTIKIIEQLSTEFQAMQQHYQQQMQKLQQQLISQKQQCKIIVQSSQEKFNSILEEYYNLMQKLKQKDETIAQLQNRLTQQQHKSKKQLSISTKIEDLRIEFEKQINQKQSIIKVYEQLVRGLRAKLIEK